MTNRTPDDLPPELLAAYADGELGAHQRDRVERWLADHPDARDMLESQESLGPANTEFWRLVRPPEPGMTRWSAVRDRIRSGTRPTAARRWFVRAGAAALAATAAALFLALPAVDRTEPIVPRVDPVAAPVPAEEPFAMATDDDVRIISLPEAAARLLIVGEHPLGDTQVLLAKSDEVEVYAQATDPQGWKPELAADTAPDDAPMIWAPRNP
jgi:hypothetical protein